MRGHLIRSTELLLCHPGENIQFAHHSNTESQHAVPELPGQTGTKVHKSTGYQEHKYIERVLNLAEPVK